MPIDTSRITDAPNSHSLNEQLVDQFNQINTPGEDGIQLYNDWANNFESDMGKVQYNHPRLLCEFIVKFMQERKIDIQSTRFLDVCAGTGLISVYFRQHNITNIDGLDGSENMLQLAKKRNLYKNYFFEIVTDESLKLVDKEAYDIVCSTGSFCPGHLNAKTLPTILSVIKPGGYFIMSLRSSFLEHPFLHDLEDTMKEMEEKKMWTKITRKKMENYFDNLEGTIYAYQKL